MTIANALLPLAALASLASVSPALALDPAQVRDHHFRPINDAKLRLVDWEGHIANPAIKVFVEPPAGAALPAVAEISVDAASGAGERVYFNCDGVVRQRCNGSSVGQGGPEKTLVFDTDEPQSFFVSIRPDRDGNDDAATLAVELDDGDGTARVRIPIEVVDQDRPSRALDFRIRIDYSRDTTRGGHGYGFFNHRDRRRVARQAAGDWAYFLADMDIDEVPRQEEETFTWSHPRGFHSGTGSSYRNTNAYTGFLLYPYGIRCEAEGQNCRADPDIRSGGAPMAGQAGQVQRSGGEVLEPELWRSGFLDLEIDGNYDRNGWARVPVTRPWYELDNDTVNDLYSIFRHELGHALAFNDQYAAFARNGDLTSRPLRRYLGSDGVPVPIDGSDHFAGAIDPVSLHGAFGNEYHGRVPPRRWLVTKLDLLLLEAVGYELRYTTPMAGLRVATESLPRGRVGEPYRVTLRAAGGVPIYDWALTSGLPQGLVLDRVTGRITGTPGRAGSFPVEAVVCDADRTDTRCPDRDLTLHVAAAGGSDGGDDGAVCAEQCDDARDRCLADGELLPRLCVQIWGQCLEEVCGLP